MNKVNFREIVSDIKSLIGRGNKTRLVVSDDTKDKVLNLPITIVILCCLMAPGIVVLSVIVGFVLGYKPKIVHSDSKKEK